MKLTTSTALTAFLFVFATGPAFAGGDPAPPTAPQPTDVSGVTIKPKPEDKVICKYQSDTGSRLGGKKICMKKSDWDTQANNARDQMTYRGPAGIAGAH